MTYLKLHLNDRQIASSRVRTRTPLYIVYKPCDCLIDASFDVGGVAQEGIINCVVDIPYFTLFLPLNFNESAYRYKWFIYDNICMLCCSNEYESLKFHYVTVVFKS